MRSLWKGSLGFGMVSVPVKLYSAIEDPRGLSKDIHQVHGECQTRIQQPKWCPHCERQLDTKAGDTIVRGYFVDKTTFIPLTEEDMESLPLKSINSIQIEHFIPGDLDVRRIKDHYYLSAEEVGVKAFVLLSSAMQALNVFGIAKLTLRGKSREHLCAIRPFEGILLLNTLNWGADIRSHSELMVHATVGEKEMEMAKAIIGQMAGERDLDEYTDEYNKALAELIQAKLDGKELPKVATAEQQETQDLVAALEASLKTTTPTPVT